VLACDGLFDVFDNGEAVEYVQQRLAQHGNVQRVCESSVHEAIHKRGSTDDVTCVIVQLQ
jgi:serine/threonine protein phosphatase PrpC